MAVLNVLPSSCAFVMPSTFPKISFEFFPPKTEKAEAAFWPAVHELAALKPEFMTVTYGAGGSTKDKTIETASRMVRETGLPIAAHLTYINTLIADLDAIEKQLLAGGIRHIIALRGDLPPDISWPLEIDKNYYQSTSEFVHALKRKFGFEISVAAYPEKHPDAPSLDADIQALKLKCDAGADRALTQFFFDNDVYYRFLDECAAAGIATPICPGLVPIHDFDALVKFAAKCQASVPVWLHEKFARVKNDSEGAKNLAIEVLTDQAMDLAKNGVRHIHFYTLNKSAITTEAIHALKAA